MRVSTDAEEEADKGLWSFRVPEVDMIMHLCSIGDIAKVPIRLVCVLQWKGGAKLQAEVTEEKNSFFFM